MKNRWSNYNLTLQSRTILWARLSWVWSYSLVRAQCCGLGELFLRSQDSLPIEFKLNQVTLRLFFSTRRTSVGVLPVKR